MLQIRRRPDLSQEPLRAHYCSQLQLQDFERDVSIVTLILIQIHNCHPALTDLTPDAVAAL